MQFFSRNCTHILARTQGEIFEYMFLDKIASKGTSLRHFVLSLFFIEVSDIARKAMSEQRIGKKALPAFSWKVVDR